MRSWNSFIPADCVWGIGRVEFESVGPGTGHCEGHGKEEEGTNCAGGSESGRGVKTYLRERGI